MSQSNQEDEKEKRVFEKLKLALAVVIVAWLIHEQIRQNAFESLLSECVESGRIERVVDMERFAINCKPSRVSFERKEWPYE